MIYELIFYNPFVKAFFSEAISSDDMEHIEKHNRLSVCARKPYTYTWNGEKVDAYRFTTIIIKKTNMLILRDRVTTEQLLKILNNNVKYYHYQINKVVTDHPELFI